MRKTSPWYGYAGYRLVDSSGKEGEIDLVLLTNCNVIVVELKDWNGNSIRSIDGKWYMDDKDMGTSPVTLTRQKQFLVLNKLKSLQKVYCKSRSYTYSPFLLSCVARLIFLICQKTKLFMLLL